MPAGQLFFPTRYTLGPGCLGEVGKRCAGLGRHFLLVSGRGALRGAGVLDAVEGNLRAAGVAFTPYEGVSGDPTVAEAEACAHAVVAAGCDGVLAIGGGGVMDVAKIAAFLPRQGGACWDYVSVGGQAARQVGDDMLPLVLVPSTAGTASEVAPFAVVTNPDIPLKKGFGGLGLFARVALVDPELHALMPPTLTAHSGLDGLTQCLESWVSTNATTVSAAFAREGFRLVWEALPRVMQDGADMRAREQVAFGVSLSGLAFTRTNLGLAHAIAHTLGAHHDIHHGLAVALVTPAATRFNAAGAPEVFRPVCQQLGVRDADALAEALAGFLAQVGVPSGLSRHGVRAEDLPTLAQETLEQGATKTNPVPVSQDDVERVLRESL